MRFDVITIFPNMVKDALKQGLVGQAVDKKLLTVKLHNPRDQAQDIHRTIDDRPFGGGDGMVMLPEILKATLDRVPKCEKRHVVYLSAAGTVFDQRKARQWLQYDQIVLISGRYGGIDQRFVDACVDEEVSLGDFILSGGEIAANAIIDTVGRLLPGVLGNPQSPKCDSFELAGTGGLLEEPLYTRPREFDGRSVPEVLFSGHHEKVEQWRKKQRILRTLERRPDLLSKASVTRSEIQEALEEWQVPRRLAVGLIHYPVYNKNGEIVATNVTHLDIHDIARACRSFGIDRYYIITPAGEQLTFVSRVLEHWSKGRGAQYNPRRQESLTIARTATSYEAALEDWGVQETVTVATSARQIAGPKPLTFAEGRALAAKKPVFLLFGTGWGLENGFVRRCDYLLEPIHGRSFDGFNHLSVRSAVSIALDRLFGSCY